MLAITERIDMEQFDHSASPVHTPHKLNSLEKLIVPSELQKQSEDETVEEASDVLTDKEKASQECSKLCTQGTDPTEIQDCIGYCERLLYNTIELQKQYPHGQSRYVYYPPTH